jgi:hypothetical protein
VHDLLKSHNAQGLNGMDPGALVPAGIWTLADVLEYGRDHGTCPYFTVRRMVCTPLTVLRCCLRVIHISCHT